MVRQSTMARRLAQTIGCLGCQADRDRRSERTETEQIVRSSYYLLIWVVVAGYLLQGQCSRFARLPRNCAT